MNWEEIEALARAKTKKRDANFYKVIGVLVKVGLLHTNYVTTYTGKVSVEDILKAGEIEPRILEVLPALMLNFGEYIVPSKNLPKDLMAILEGERPVEFRGLNYRQWI